MEELTRRATRRSSVSLGVIRSLFPFSVKPLCAKSPPLNISVHSIIGKACLPVRHNICGELRAFGGPETAAACGEPCLCWSGSRSPMYNGNNIGV